MSSQQKKPSAESQKKKGDMGWYYNPFVALENDPRAKRYEEEILAKLRLATALYQARTEQKCTIEELAKRAHTTPAVISRIENSQVSAGIALISKLFKALGKKELVISLV